jgi:hypothetical protein
MSARTPRAWQGTRRSVAVLAAATLAVCIAGCAARADEPRLDRSDETPAVAPTPSGPAVAVGSAALPAPTAAAAPTRLRIPDLDVDMPVSPVGVTDRGQMELPADPAVAGWYRFGPAADSTTGKIVLAAHVDAPRYPIGPLARVRDAGAGSAVTVADSTGANRTYRVVSVTHYEKSALPTAELFARDGSPALVVITCGGPFDQATGHYRDNIVLLAVPDTGL